MKPVLSSTPVISRVVLRTPDAARLAAFYQRLLGLLPQADPADRRSVALLHPLSGATLMTLTEEPGARPAPPQAPGLFHVAFLFPGARFMARDGYHHHLAINTWRTDPLVSRPDNAAGLVGWDMTQAGDGPAALWRDPNGFVVTLSTH